MAVPEINKSGILAAIITLIVLPAFMYSGYMVPFEQMADLPVRIGGWFPLRYYLKALYLVFNHHQPLAVAVIGGFIIALPLLLIVFPSLIRILKV